MATWQTIDDYLRARGVRIGPPRAGQTTGGGHSRGSYHYRGLARDYGDADSDCRAVVDALLPFAKGAKHILPELFYSPTNTFYKNGLRLPYVSASLRRSHQDHVHVAIKANATFPTITPTPAQTPTKEQAMSVAIEPVTAITRSHGGGWVFGARGHVYAFDGALHYGGWDDATRADSNRRCVGLVPATDGLGYFLVSNRGEIYGYGSVAHCHPGNYRAEWGAGAIVGAFANDRQPNGGVTLVRDDGENLNLYRLPA